MSFEATTTEQHERRIKRCKATDCRARIVWLRSRSGSSHPVDADSVSPDDTDFDPKKGHVSHFATCPAASKFRKPKWHPSHR